MLDTANESKHTEARWRIELLGGLRAGRGKVSVTHFRTQKSALLLAYLALSSAGSRRQRSHLRDDLAYLLWPDSDARSARDSLRCALSLVRRVLEPEGTPHGSILIADRASVQLSPEAITTDVAEFETALEAAARAGSGEEGARWLVRAIDLYRGELLAGHFDDWVLQERQWLAERYFQALDRLVAHLEEAGDLQRALDYARRSLDLDPLREEMHGALMRLYGVLGQVAAARRQYQELQRVLRQELGAEPSAATRALLREIEQGTLAAGAADRSPGGRRVASSPSRPGRRVANPRRSTDESRLITILGVEVRADSPPGQPLSVAQPGAQAVPSSSRPTGPLHHWFGTVVDAVLRYEGRIDAFPGDGVLALFGAVRTHEDDAERAIHAALAIREAARKLELEVTAVISSGLFVPSAASAAQVAPLRTHVRSGEILVDETTYSLTRRAFEFSPWYFAPDAPADAAPLDSPVKTFAVERARPSPEKPRGIEGRLTPLIGREDELTRLQAAFARVLEGHGQMVSLSGEAGVGKSRLVAELKTRAGGPWSVISETASNCPLTTDHGPLLWLEGRALELSTAAGYSLFVDLFREFFAWGPEETEGERAARLATCLEGFVARGDLRTKQADEMGPLLGNLLSLRFGSDWDLRLKNTPPEQIRHQTLLAVRDFIVALARRGPVVLVLEDLHWADPLSLDLIALLLEALPAAPLLLFCVARPERAHRSFRLGEVAARKCPECFTEVRLRELTPSKSRALLEALGGGANLPGPVQTQILETARGNPFFVEEMIRSLIRSGAYDPQGAEFSAVPATVQGVIRSRVDRLESGLKVVLRCASVVGRLFRRRVLEHALGSPGAGQKRNSGAGDPGALDRSLAALAQEALIYEERLVPDEEFSFQHVLTQETIYHSIPERERQRLHQQVAEALEWVYRDELEAYYEPLAYHYERSTANEKAVEYLLKAGEKARRAYLNEAAIGCFQRALERLDGCALGETRKEWRLEALKGLGQISLGVGNVAEAEQCFRKAIALGQEMQLAPRILVRLYWWLSEVLYWQSRRDEMCPIGREGLALLGDDTESVEAAMMIQLSGDLLGNAPLIERLPYSEELRSAYELLAHAYLHERKDADEAARWLQILEHRGKECHDQRALATVYDWRVRIAAARGDLHGALAGFQRAQDGIAGLGDPRLGTEVLLENLAWVSLALGDLPRAAEHARRGLQLAERVGDRVSLSIAYLLMGMVSLCDGSWREATEALRRGRQIRLEVSTPGGCADAWAALIHGWAYLSLGEPREAARQFQVAAPHPHLRVAALSGLEAAFDDPEAFRSFCCRLRKEHPDESTSPFVQWFLEPTEPLAFSQRRVHDEFPFFSPDWVWCDPFGDCSLTLRNGLEIHAANGRDLLHVNVSAPRLLRPAAGDFAIQTVCVPAVNDRPAIGGLLLWKDEQNYLRLDRGTRGPHEVSFQGCLNDKDVVIGRGRLPSKRIFLGLERRGGQVNALCSAEGDHWFTAGCAEFPAADPHAPSVSLRVGLHAIGMIDRTIYPGAYLEGAAIRFERFEQWH